MKAGFLCDSSQDWLGCFKHAHHWMRSCTSIYRSSHFLYQVRQMFTPMHDLVRLPTSSKSGSASASLELADSLGEPKIDPAILSKPLPSPLDPDHTLPRTPPPHPPLSSRLKSNPLRHSPSLSPPFPCFLTPKLVLQPQTLHRRAHGSSIPASHCALTQTSVTTNVPGTLPGRAQHSPVSFTYPQTEYQ